MLYIYLFDLLQNIFQMPYSIDRIKKLERNPNQFHIDIIPASSVSSINIHFLILVLLNTRGHLMNDAIFFICSFDVTCSIIQATFWRNQFQCECFSSRSCRSTHPLTMDFMVFYEKETQFLAKFPFLLLSRQQ